MALNGEKMGIKKIIKNVLRLMNEYKFTFTFAGVCAICVAI